MKHCRIRRKFEQHTIQDVIDLSDDGERPVPCTPDHANPDLPLERC